MREAADIAETISTDDIERFAFNLALSTGRIYVIGLGGSMANAIHMAADLRRLCDLDAEAFDNIAELTAAMNDDGPQHIFDGWLSRATKNDILIVLSVGGGSKKVSPALMRSACCFPGITMGIVGSKRGYISKISKYVIHVPNVNPDRITPHTEAFQAVIWHCLVSHPILQKRATKW